MNLEIKGIHYELDDETREYIEKKLHRVDFATDLLIDLQITIKYEKNQYTIESNLNFRWGYTTHIKVVSFDLREGVDKFMDKLDNKLLKEKDKIQQHQ